MELHDRLNTLASLRAAWREPQAPDELALRRAYAAWCNAGIEGNALAWERFSQVVLPAGSANSALENEPLGCLAALDFLEEQGPELPLGLPLLRHLHILLMRGLAGSPGEFRRREVRIVRERGPQAGETVFAPPHPHRVEELLEALLRKVRSSAGEDCFLVAGSFHYEFQSIHPFMDGNGRLGRLLASHLARRGWQGAGFHLEPAIRRAGPAYYLALRAVRPDFQSVPRDGLRPWLMPFLDMAEDALRRPGLPILPP